MLLFDDDYLASEDIGHFVHIHDDSLFTLSNQTGALITPAHPRIIITNNAVVIFRRVSYISSHDRTCHEMQTDGNHYSA